MRKGSEFFEIVTVLKPDADRYNGDPATDVLNMKYWSHVDFFVAEAAGGTGTVKIQVEECTAKAGTGNTALAAKYRVRDMTDAWGGWTALASTGYTTTAGADKEVLVSVDADELSDGYPYVRLQLTEVADSPVDAAVVAVLSGPRYPQETPNISLS